MNAILKKSITLTAIVFFQLHVLAQTTAEPPAVYLNFSTLTIKDGLSQGMINYMLQDHFGFMWFATKDGLNRYDGYRFVVYRNDIANPFSLGDNHVRCLFEDSKGRLWIGTENNGVDLFDRNTEKFIHFRKKENSKNGLTDNRINNFTEDKAGNIWISTENGINIISFSANDNKTDTTIRVPVLNPATPGKLILSGSKNYAVKSSLLFTDSKGCTWVFIGSTSYRVTEKDGALYISAFHIEEHLASPATLDYRIISFAEDTARKYLYALSAGTVFRINQVNGKIDYADYKQYSRGVISVQSTVAEDGLIWFTNLGRLNTIDFDSKAVKQIYYANNGSVADGAFNVYKDRSGVMWIGTAGYGIIKYLPMTSKFHFISFRSVSIMEENYPDQLNVGGSTAKNLLFDMNEGKFVYKDPPAKKLLQQFGTINELDFTYFNGRHSFSAKGYLYWCDIKSGQVKLLRHLYERPQIVNDTAGIWVGSQDSLLYLDEEERIVKTFAYPVTAESIPYNFCMRMIKDGKENLWLATMKGLLCFNTRTHAWKRYNHIENDTTSLSSDILFSVCADPVEPLRYIWAGTEGAGVNRLDVQTGKIKSYREKDGLPNAVIYGIVSDNSSRIWMSTNKGISSFNTITKTFSNYDETDGLQGNEFNRYAYGRSSSGWIYFGGINGFNYFKPEEMHLDTIFPRVILTDFKVSNKSVDFSEANAVLSKPVFLSDKIELPYRDNMISFDFTAINFSQPEKNYYQYKLDGFDEDWIPAGKSHTATYTNLDPGTYTFFVRASNQPGAWSNDATTIVLTIIPPWYMTWWFRTAIIITVAGGIYALYRYRLKQALQLQLVRNRIAADLHDEIGSTLSSISIFSEVIEDQTKEQLPEVTPVIKRINESTVNMMEAMSDIVWTINPKNDRFENIIVRMQSFASEVLEAVNCSLHIHVDSKIEQLKLSMEIRKNFYLIFKEAVNNISKYANAKHADISIRMKNGNLFLRIADDGKGFNTETNKQGNGLLNMKKRAEELKGGCEVISSPEQGTIINVWFPV